jgi:hypothetical protein
MDDWLAKLKRAALLSPTAAAGAPVPSAPAKTGASGVEDLEKSRLDTFCAAVLFFNRFYVC